MISEELSKLPNTEGMKHCWLAVRSGRIIECEVSGCCYDQASQAVFDYWKYANSDEWKKILENQLNKEKEKSVRKIQTVLSEEFDEPPVNFEDIAISIYNKLKENE